MVPSMDCESEQKLSNLNFERSKLQASSGASPFAFRRLGRRSAIPLPLCRAHEVI